MKYLSLSLTKENELPFIIDKIMYKLDNEIISFNYENTLYKINPITQIFERENDEFLFKFNFINKKCIYKLKSVNLTLDIKVEKSTFIQKKDEIIINYMIESDPSEINIKIKFYEEE